MSARTCSCGKDEKQEEAAGFRVFTGGMQDMSQHRCQHPQEPHQPSIMS